MCTCAEIKRRMGIRFGKVVIKLCIASIFPASIYIARRITKKGIILEVVDEASVRVDYAIKKVIDVVNEVTERKQKDLVAGFMQM